MRGQRGFTLLEVLVATVIMAVAVSGCLSALSTSMNNAARLTEVDRAAMLARHKMDEILIEKKLPRNTVLQGPYEPVMLGGTTGGWRAQISTFERATTPAPGAPMLDRIQLEIWWMAGDQRRTFTLDGYRRVRLTPQEMAAGGFVPQ